MHNGQNQKIEKQIRRYCIFPKVARVAVLVAFVLCFLILPLEMIDDLVFHHEGFQPYGLFTALGLIAVYMVIFCYCSLYPKFGMCGKRWKGLQKKMRIAQMETDRSAQIAGTLAMQASGRFLRKSNNDTAKHIGGAMEAAAAVGAVATASEMLSEVQENAENMAAAYGVTIPQISKQLLAFAILPVIILVGVYIPQYVQASQDMQESILSSAERVCTVRDALIPVCEYVAAEDPNERYQDYGYHVIGYLRKRGQNVQTCYVYITFDADGILTGLHYVDEIDIHTSFEENLSRIERDFETLHAPLGRLSAPASNSELLTLYKLPEEFEEAVEAGSLYENIHIRMDEYPVNVSCIFDTVSEKEFDEYSRPSITLMLS